VLVAACSPIKPAQAPERPGSKAGAAAAADATSPWLEVRDVRVEPVGSGRRVTFALSREPEGVQDFALGTPPRLVVDLNGPRPSAPATVSSFPFPDDLVSQVRVGSHGASLRAVIDLSRNPGAHLVRHDGNTLTIDFGDTGVASNADAPLEAEPIPAAAHYIEAEAVESPYLTVRDVRIEPSGSGRRLTISLTRVPDGVHDFVLGTPPRLVIDLKGPSPKKATMSKYPLSDPVVSRVRAASTGGTLRVVVDLTDKAKRHTVRQEGSRLIAELGDTKVADAGDAGAFASADDSIDGSDVKQVAFIESDPASAPEPVRIAEAGEAPAPEPVAAPADPAPAEDPEAEPAPPRQKKEEHARATAPSPRTASLGGPSGEFRGQRISLDFKDADVQNVLRVLADVSGLNIIATDDVRGKVTLHLNDVPWDQALDLVLRSNRLEQTREGNVVRISTVSRLKEEREALRAAQDAERELEPLRVKYVKVNYARADEALIDKVKGVLTDRGSVTFDDRTNTIIVRDIPRGIDDAMELVHELDVQSPQVLIEANIVEATEDFARALGVQWGYQHTAGPQTGNPTGANFPGTIGVGGSGLGAGVPAPAPTAGVTRLPVPFIADFPVPAGFGSGFGPGVGSALDLALGSIDGTSSLTARLTALEEEGKGRVVSRPRVITMNNVAATIQSLTILRVKLPGTGTVINTGAGGAAGSASTATEKINTGITLVVTPQISSDGYVLMNIYAKSSQPDFTRTVDGIPNEISREANSNVLIRDAETVVLGGIFRQTDDNRESGLPYLRNIPALGWLFKRMLQNKHHEELLVFLTPKIVSATSGNLPVAERLWEGRRKGG
jgi:type IV pilus assembly protein PilQ